MECNGQETVPAPQALLTMMLMGMQRSGDGSPASSKLSKLLPPPPQVRYVAARARHRNRCQELQASMRFSRASNHLRMRPLLSEASHLRRAVRCHGTRGPCSVLMTIFYVTKRLSTLSRSSTLSTLGHSKKFMGLLTNFALGCLASSTCSMSSPPSMPAQKVEP